MSSKPHTSAAPPRGRQPKRYQIVSLGDHSHFVLDRDQKVGDGSYLQSGPYWFRRTAIAMLKDFEARDAAEFEP